MAGFVIVIGGQSRNVGKTSVVCALIAAMPERHWTAIKISGHPHGELGSAVTVYEEHDACGGSDSARYLAAGARRSLLVCALEGQLAEAMPLVRAEIAAGENVIIESNSVLEYLKPDVFAMVVTTEAGDVKASARRYADHAHALLLSGLPSEGSQGASLSWPEGGPRFRIAPPAYSSPEFAEFVRQTMRLSQFERPETL